MFLFRLTQVNLGKTKVMKCCEGAGLRERSGKFPCGVWRKGVGTNSIQCTSCMSCIHKKCGVEGRLQLGVDFLCRKCGNCDITSQVERKEIEIDVNEKLECVEQFCYVGDMIEAGGGAGDASRVR